MVLVMKLYRGSSSVPSWEVEGEEPPLLQWQ